MKIIRVDTFPLLYLLPKPYGDANGFKKYRTCFLFRITTSSGIEGWGECIDWLPTLEKGFRERIIPFLLGKEATNRVHIVDVVKKWHQRAAAGVSMALTEIVAKYAKLSICDLWGGKFRDKIPVYASFQSYTNDSEWLQQSLNLVNKSIQNGYSQLKVKIGGKMVAEDQKHIHQIQDMVEGKVHLAIDANQSYDLSTTREWVAYLQQWSNIMWLEEPMPLDNIKEYLLLRSISRVPVAGGENLLSMKKFIPLLREGVLDIIQPDVIHVQGVDDFRNTLHLARGFGLRASAHCFDGALSRLYALFSQASLPSWSKMSGNDIEPIEWDVMENPFSELIPLKPFAGRVEVPTGIGIGIELDQEIIQAYLWDGTYYV